MTPEEARAAYEAMSPENKALFEEFVGKVCDVVARVEAGISEAGQAMANDAEVWLREESA